MYSTKIISVPSEDKERRKMYILLSYLVMSINTFLKFFFNCVVLGHYQPLNKCLVSLLYQI